MKKITTNINFLKLGGLLFGVLLLWNCEKEDEQIPLQESLSEILQSEFNSEEFTKTLPYKYEVDWNDPKKQFSDQLETSFYEFSIIYTDAFNPKTFNKQKKRNFYKKYKIVVTEKQEGKFDFFIATYYLRNNEENPDVENTFVNLNLNSGYEGTVHLYDKEGKMVFAKHVNRKDKSDDFFLENKSDSSDDKGKTLAKAPPIKVCKTVTKSLYADRYWVVVDRYGNIISSTYINTVFVRYIQVEECHYEWLPDNYDDDDRCIEVDGLCAMEYKPLPIPCLEGYSPDENGNCVRQELVEVPEGLISASTKINTILDSSLTSEQLLWLSENNKAASSTHSFLIQNPNSTEAKNFAKLAIEALINGGEVDFDDRIINELTGKALCVYNKLKELSGGFKDAIQKFDGEFPVSHLKFTINNRLGSSVYGITIPPVNYVTEIQINGNRLSNLSDLGAATTFAHEVIHAEIFRKMLSAAQKGDLNYNNRQTYTTQDRINYINSLKDNFTGLYDYYFDRWHPTWNHNMMASHYRNTIVDIIQEFDNDRLSSSIYEAVAWAGLVTLEDGQTSIAWNSLSVSERITIC